MAKTTKKKTKNYSYASGRRKTSSVRVRLHKGEGEHTINGMLIGKYFPGEGMRYIWNKPFALTGTEGKFFVTAKVSGGGKNSQLKALAHAIARAFVVLDTDKYRKLLKKGGLLTRDSRIRERRKVGTGGRARRAKQSPKR
jgi:small subunit ribosomal protein S9